MPSNRILLLGILVMIALSGSIGAAIWQANAQSERLVYDEPIQSSLTAEQTQSWFFDGFRDDVLQLSLDTRASELIPLISLRDERGALQAQLQGGAGGLSTFSFRLNSFGTFSLEISSVEATSGDYTLTVSLLEAGRRSFEQGALSYGQNVNQRLSDLQYYNLWTFEGRVGQVIDIRMAATSGDLAPRLVLLTPSGDPISFANGADQIATLQAVRLPVNGIYSIRAQRIGADLGARGETSGGYNLELTLRNGPNISASRLEPAEARQGLLTPDSPLTRYQISGGAISIQVELADPNCLVDVAILSEGLILRERFVGLTPLVIPLDIAAITTPIMEVSAVNCVINAPMAYNLRYTPLNVALPLKPLKLNQTLRGGANAETERWFFQAEANDMLELNIHKDNPSQYTTLILLGPDGGTLYNGSFFQSLQETLLLERGGLYALTISPTSSPYDLAVNLVGLEGLRFTQMTPIWESNLDISSPQTWQIAVSASSSAILVVQDPLGGLVGIDRSKRLSGPRLDSLTLRDVGRYQIKVFSEQDPSAVNIFPVFDPRLPLNGHIKGTLTAPDDANRWQIPITQPTNFNLTLELLTPAAALPNLALVDGNGLQVRPILTNTLDNRLELLGIRAPSAGVYQVIVVGSPATTQLDYRLRVDSPLYSVNQPANTLSLTLPPSDGITPQRISPRSIPIMPPLADNLFSSASPINVPGSLNAEMPPNKLRDVWSLNIQRNQRIVIKSTALDGGSAPGLILLDANRNIISEHWERELNYNQITYRSPIAGQFYLVTTLNELGGRYTLNIETMPNVDESVPTIEPWYPLSIGQPLAGTFDRSREVDNYAFWGTRGSRLIVNALHEVGALTPAIRVFDPNGNPIQAADFDTTTRRAQTEAFNLNLAGLYRVEVTANPSDSRDPFSRYSVLVSLLRGEYSYQGLLSDAAVGSLATSSSADTWLLWGEAGETISLSAQPLNRVGPSPLILTLQDTNGTAFLSATSSLVVNSVEINNVTLPRTGLYRLRVSGATNSSGSYRLLLNRQPAPTATSAPLTYGQSVKGVFNAGAIVQRWVLNGNAGDVIALALRPTLGDPAPLGFQLENAEGAILRVGADREMNIGAREENILLPETGLYYVTVGVVDPAFEGALAYHLSVERQNYTEARSFGSLLPPNTPAEGVIYADDRSDIWLFSGWAGEIINLNLFGDGVLIPIISLFDADRFRVNGQLEPLLSRTGTLTDPARLVQYSLPHSGTYAVLVSGVGDSVGYYNLQREIVGTAESASLLEADSPQNGQTTSNGQAWDFLGGAGERISLTIQPTGRLSFVPEIILKAPDGQILLIKRDFAQRNLSLESYPLPSDGIYQVSVRAATSLNPNNGSYQITLRKTPPPAPEAIQPLSYGESKIGEFNASNRLDIWAFSGVAGEVVRILSEATSGNLDLTLTLISPSGQTIALADDNAGGLNASINAVLPEDGLYLVQLAPYGGSAGSSNGNYRMDFNLAYRPSTENPLENSPNQTINYGERIVSALERGTGTGNARWRFDGRAGDSISAYLQFPDNARLLLLFLEDGAGNRYIQGERLQNRVAIENFTLPADGSYSLYIQGAEDRNSYYPYSLSLNLMASTPPSEATNGGFVTRGQSYVAAFQAQNPVHQWLFSGLADENIYINLLQTGGASEIELLILGTDNRPILQAKSSDSPLQVRLPADGLYQLISVNPLDDPFAAYRLQITTTDAPQQVIGLLQTAQITNGFMDSSQQEQVWLLEGEAGQVITGRAGIVAGNLEITFRLEDENGLPLALAERNALQDQMILPTLVLPHSTTYRVIVQKTGDQVDMAGSYRLLLSEFPALPEALAAQPLAPNIPSTGFENAGLRQLYILEAQRNVPLSLRVIVTDGAEVPLLRLLTLDGLPLMDAEGFITDFFPPQDGPYLVEVSTRTPTGYSIRYTPRPNLNIEGQVIRNVTRQVNLAGSLSIDTPSALWTIDAEAGETLIITLEDFNRNARLDLVLFAPDGTPIATALEAESETRLSLGPIFIGRGGPHSLRIGRWKGQIDSGDQRYILKVERAPADAGLGSEGGRMPILGQMVYGGLNLDDPSDTWTFDGTAGHQINLDLSRQSGNAGLRLVLLDPLDNPIDLAAYQRQQNGVLQLNNLPLELSGVYRAIIRLADDSDPQTHIYQLRITDQGLNLGQSLSRARSLPLNSSAQSDLSAAEGVEAWTFYAPAGGRIRIALEGLPNALLTLIAPDNTPLIAAKASAIEGFLLTQDGFHAVIVSSPDPAPYTLVVEEAPQRSDWRWTISPGQSERVGFGFRNEVHEWALADYGAGMYEILVRPTSLAWQAKVFLLNGGGVVISEGLVLPDGSTRLEAYLNPEASAGYTVLVVGDNRAGRYDLRFDLSQNLDSPAPLVLGQTSSGRINPLDIADEWLWDATSANPYHLRVNRVEGDFALVVRLYAPGNLFLQEFIADAEGVIDVENILIPVAGRYIVQVSRLDQAFSNAEGRYELLIEAQPAP